MHRGSLGLLTLEDLEEIDVSTAQFLKSWFDHPAGEPLRPGTELLAFVNEILPGDGVNVSASFYFDTIVSTTLNHVYETAHMVAFREGLDIHGAFSQVDTPYCPSLFAWR
jgi:hypothetical protein